MGSLSNDDGVVNENGKKAISLDWQTRALHVHHAVLYISLPSPQEYDVKMPNSRGREHETQLSFSFRELWYSRLEFKSKKIANIWRIIRDGISRRLRKSSIVGTEVSGFFEMAFH